jgi:hypothetical protein
MGSSDSTKSHGEGQAEGEIFSEKAGIKVPAGF